MTGLGSLMKTAGYSTVFAGKWDAGMATPHHSPRGRGYDSSLAYFNHYNDYWTLRAGEACPSNNTGHSWHAYIKQPNGTFAVRDGYLAAGDDWVTAREATLPEAEKLCRSSDVCLGFTFKDYSRSPPPTASLNFSFKSAIHFVRDTGEQMKDLWLDDAPAKALVSPQPRCSGVPFPADAAGCAFEEDLFRDHVLRAVRGWSAERTGDKPLFVFWAFHAAHSPYQLPKPDVDRFAFVPEARRIYHATVARMDAAIGDLVATMRERHMWEQSLLVFCSDNGGPITQQANVRPPPPRSFAIELCAACPPCLPLPSLARPPGC